MKTDYQILEDIIAYLENNFDYTGDEVTLKTTLEYDLLLNHLDKLEMLLYFERLYNIYISIDRIDLNQIVTIQELINYLQTFNLS
jgi:acyl carrier protein